MFDPIDMELFNLVEEILPQIVCDMKPCEHHITSESDEDWVYSTDKFISPLSGEELNKYIESPLKFKVDFLNNLMKFKSICNEIYSRFLAMSEGGRYDEVELLSIAIFYLKIYQVAMDKLYYKYDRHFEYTNTEKSPVGYYWIKLNEICKNEAQKTGVDEFEIKQKYLNYFGDRTISKKYIFTCIELKKEIYQIEIKANNIEQLKKENAYLYEKVSNYSNVFYKDINMFFEDIDNITQINMNENFVEITFNDEELVKKTIINGLRTFIETQEEESFMFYSTNNKSIFDTGFILWNEIDKVIKKHIKNEDILSQLNRNPIYGTRYLLHNGLEHLDRKVQKNYKKLIEEINRYGV